MCPPPQGYSGAIKKERGAEKLKPGVEFGKPGMLEEAKQAHERLCQMAQKAGGKPPEPFDQTAWLRTAKRTAVRSKPYPLQEAAQLCKELAIKAGWLDVQLQEIKKLVA